MTDTVHICEGCREVVDPDAPGVVKAYEQSEVSTFPAEGREFIDGLGVYFHENCYPHGSRRYRLAD